VAFAQHYGGFESVGYFHDLSCGASVEACGVLDGNGLDDHGIPQFSLWGYL